MVWSIYRSNFDRPFDERSSHNFGHICFNGGGDTSTYMRTPITAKSASVISDLLKDIRSGRNKPYAPPIRSTQILSLEKT